ncbi:right-handed parallel beta-helix repeat-containing protein [Dactylosporangium sp. NPDC049525]|uniref:beta strand repeat-containing protein n=1 Tax=Dactylosporangium sp. NPDC049525 TaxID=3154730 RepID=UPI0034345822
MNPVQIRGPGLVAAVVLAIVGASGLPAAAVPPLLIPITVVFTVTNTADAGAGSLRDAITAANGIALPNRSKINFNIPNAGPHTITPVNDLPALTGWATVDGYSQPGTARATAVAPAVLDIVVNAVNTTRGLELATSDSTVSGLVIRGSNAAAAAGAPCVDDGICVRGDRNVITGNYIGLGVAGLNAFGNSGDGIDLDGTGNRVGGTLPGDRNVISSNGNHGIRAVGTGAVIQGNLIGLNANGTGLFGNGETGVSLVGDTGTVGGSTAGAGNVISNNGRHGVLLDGDTNTVQGNLIGTNAAGTADRGNGTDGVFVAGVGNVIGGSANAAGNVISGNGASGVFTDSSADGTVIRGNTIGTGIGGNTAIGNDDGVKIEGINNVVDANLISGNLLDGVELHEQFGNVTTGNIVQANLIGTTRNGLNPLGNGDHGIDVRVLATGNRIAGNVIAANNAGGIYLFGPGTTVEKNLVGTDRTGAAPLPNTGAGVEVDGDGNVLTGNTIAANTGDGIEISADNTLVTGNFIGTDPTGTVALGNLGSGVTIGGNGNQIGSGAAAVPINTIANNQLDGVTVSSGTDNPIRRNAIYGNADLGIDLGNTGVLPNDAGDVDVGDNDLQNYPVIAAATTVTATWALDGQPATTYQIEFFVNTVCSASGHGEGRKFLGALTVTTPAAAGAASGIYTFAVPTSPGQQVTATATVLPAGAAVGPTSEFAACVTAV